MNVVFYNFSKRKNSTKQPTSTGTTVVVTLKQPTDIEAPVLLLSGNDFSYNYAYISDFSRYYFVNKIISMANGLVQVELTEDLLASAKSAIGSTSAYIAYASTGYNIDIVDPRLIARANRVYQDVAVESSGLSAGGTYILGLINDDNRFDNFGVVNYYAVSRANLKLFTHTFSDPNIWQAITQSFDDPWGAVVSLTWVPYYIDPINGLANHTDTASELTLPTLRCYDQDVDGKGRFIYDPIITLGTVSITIPYSSSDYRDAAPFREFSLYLPGVGYTDISAADLYGSSVISISATIDIVHGDLIYKILDGNSRLIKTVTTNASVTQPLAHATYNAAGGLTTALGSVGGATTAAIGFGTGNIMMGAAGLGAMGLSAANMVMQANKHSMSIKGADNGKAQFQDVTYKLYETVIDTEDPTSANYIAKFGRPVGHVGTISSYSGYIQCENASVDIQGLANERDQINNYLNTGFFYE